MADLMTSPDQPTGDQLSLRELIHHYGKDYLICDGRIPCISNGLVSEELLLYGIDELGANRIFSSMEELTGKIIDQNLQIQTLSGGQKVVLIVLIALQSSAPRILFSNIFQPLDNERRHAVATLLESITDREIMVL